MFQVAEKTAMSRAESALPDEEHGPIKEEVVVNADLKT